LNFNDPRGFPMVRRRTKLGGQHSVGRDPEFERRRVRDAIAKHVAGKNPARD
jgi:hypothetical protein